MLLYNHSKSRKEKKTYKTALELNMRDKEVERPSLSPHAGHTPVKKAGLQGDQACGVREELQELNSWVRVLRAQERQRVNLWGLRVGGAGQLELGSGKGALGHHRSSGLADRGTHCEPGRQARESLSFPGSGATHESPKQKEAFKVTLDVFTLATARLCSKLSSPKKLPWTPCNVMNFCKSMSIHLDPAVGWHSLENTIWAQGAYTEWKESGPSKWPTATWGEACTVLIAFFRCQHPKALPRSDGHLRAVRSNPALPWVAVLASLRGSEPAPEAPGRGSQEPASLPPRGWGDRPSPTIVAFTIVNSNNPVT